MTCLSRKRSTHFELKDFTVICNYQQLQVIPCTATTTERRIAMTRRKEKAMMTTQEIIELATADRTTSKAMSLLVFLAKNVSVLEERLTEMTSQKLG
jgi:hypothetical protein